MLDIIPEPLSIQYKSGVFKSIGIPITEGDFQDETAVFKAQFEGAEYDAERKIIGKKDETLKGEAYTLALEPETITIRAGTGAGAYRALQAIRQLLLSNAEIPCAFIEDKPQFAWRGFMLDSSRYFYSVPFIKKLIDALSMHHINIFHWHLTDDQGWRLPIPEYPLLAEIGSKRVERRLSGEPYTGGFYAESDIREIAAFATARHIEIVPEVDLPGHASAILAAYPGLGCTGGPYRVEDRFGIFEDVLCAGNNEIFDLADAVFNALARLFPSKYVHIGGDEVRFNRWSACPKCKKRLAETGLSTPRELQSWITVKLVEKLAEKGKIAIGWDEVLEDSQKYPLPKELAVMSWRGAEGGKAAVKRGHPVIMSPNTQGCYFDYRNADEVEEPGQWGVSTAFQAYTMNPLEDMSQAESSLVLGAQCNLWSELIYAGKIAEYMIFPRIAAFAENVWSSPEKKDFQNFERKLAAHRARLDKLGVNQYRGSLK
jgi:hexosaminidase